MPSSELRVRASVWNLLSIRRDADNLTLELLGRYHVDLAGATPEIADHLAFSLACQLEAIFDLQRTHLQSRTPYWEFDSLEHAHAAKERVAERIPYLLSFSVAKRVFKCLAEIALPYISDDRDGESSLRRMVFIRALMSGVRMLCLHPSVEPGIRLDDEVFRFREGILIEVCDAALRRVPERHQYLHLPRMGYNREMFPLDESRWTEVVTECTTSFNSDPTNKYWTLYDISWSVVASYVQFWAMAGKHVDKPPAYPASAAVDIEKIAMDIAEPAMGEAFRLAKPTMDEASRLELSEDVKKPLALLLDIVEVLSPILLNPEDGGGSTWKASYEKILRHIGGDHTPICKEYFAQKTLALEKFEAVLKRREQALCYSNEELPRLLDDIEKQCSDYVEEYNRKFSYQPSGLSGYAPERAAVTKLYVVSCDATHIITDDQIPGVGGDHDLLRDNGCLNFPEGFVCPICPLGANLANRLREISPLSGILETTKQKRLDLGELRRDRENLEQDPFEYSGSSAQDLDGIHVTASTSTSSHQEHLARRESTTSSSDASSHPDPRPVKTPPTPTSPPLLQGRSWGRKIVRKLTLSAAPAAPNAQEVYSIDLQPLGAKPKQIAPSADCNHFIFYTSEKLGLFCDTLKGEPMVAPSPVENPGRIVASASYCAIVERARDHDQIIFVNSKKKFEHFGVHRVIGEVQCLAFSPDEAYLAVGLEKGIVQILKMEGYRNPTASRPALEPGLPVVGLSFSADASELVVGMRDGAVFHAITSPRPFVKLDKHYSDAAVPQREDDDQGISSVIRCPKRNLLCITYWTQSGRPLLYDCLQKKRQRLDQDENSHLNRVQQAVFSKSGRILVLINQYGSIFRATIHDIESPKVEEIGKSRRFSCTTGKSQVLNVKISEDEKWLRLVWVDRNRAHVTEYALD
ncbi:MAG: hypothetical protein M1813_002067 [Trichoglossum hirsutum]|nr:MAG: hypothetical protein M1813_002067 [Trichoglossum hirsutum]